MSHGRGAAWVLRSPFRLDVREEQNEEPGRWLGPRQVLRKLEKAMPPRALVPTDFGHIDAVANRRLRFEVQAQKEKAGPR